MAKSPVEAIAAEKDAATLDRVMRKAPVHVTRQDLGDLVIALRGQRARFIAADAAKAAKKEGIEDHDNSDAFADDLDSAD